MPPTELDDAAVVRAYKSLAAVERAFRHLKTVDLELRPFYVRDPGAYRRLRLRAQYLDHEDDVRLVALALVA